VDAADLGWRRLGALLVEAGLVSEHDLVEALDEQERSGQRLGEVLVARGLVSAAAVANALAEQRGSFLKTEYGFGTGLRALMDRSNVPDSEATPPEVPPLSPTQPPARAVGDTPAAAVDSTASAKRGEAEPAVSGGRRGRSRGRQRHRRPQPRRELVEDSDPRAVLRRRGSHVQISGTSSLCPLIRAICSCSAAAAPRPSAKYSSSRTPRAFDW
jgi:hypothetical protein